MNKKLKKSKIPVIVWGASGQAEVVSDILHTSNQYTIEAYIDNVSNKQEGESFRGKPILTTEQQVKEIFSTGVTHAIVAVGDIDARKKLVSILQEIGFTFVNAVHKTVIIGSQVNLGINLIIKPGAIIDPRVVIGNHSYIGAGVTIGHHSSIGNYVNITGGSRISGHVNIKNEVFIGTGSSIKNRITIGEKSVVGVGSVVISDIPPNTVAKGVPAKIS